jgi:hypothetical protein
LPGRGIRSGGTIGAPLPRPVRYAQLT